MAKGDRPLQIKSDITVDTVLKDGAFVATVLTRNTGTAVTVNVTQSYAAAERSRIRAEINKTKPKSATATYDEAFEYQAARAGGGGYDRATAALAGMIIDGHVMANHASRIGAPPRPETAPYPADSKPPAGYRYANYVEGGGESGYGAQFPAGTSGYADCYREPGLGFLRDNGYQIITTVTY